jgi:SAM-dependent methyltransferase
MWQLLCQRFFQRYIPDRSVVLELGAGYCEFINHIQAKKKIAVDINPDTSRYADQNVQVLISSSDHIQDLEDGTVDIIFASNFLEHLERKSILATIREAHRILSPGGKLIILQPNVRFCYRDYWMFFDHITPIDDRALIEVLETNGMEISEVITRFLPFTTKGNLPRSIFLLKLYLFLRPAWLLFGKQSLIVSLKPGVES